MLQQTQVATVLPYYPRFMEAFPSLEALDRASLGVPSGAAWDYRRAANLKEAAHLLVSRHDGRLRRTTRRCCACRASGGIPRARS